jgi:CheY-like chemotaxis protein
MKRLNYLNLSTRTVPIDRGGPAGWSYADIIMKSSVKTVTKEIRVIIADDHPVVLAGLAAMLRSQKDIKVVAEATDGVEVCELYDQLSPDLLMLDLRMPKKDGLQVVTELMSRSGVPKPRIIVMTTYESEEDVRRALRAGAKGYLVKGAAPNKSGRLCGKSLREKPCFHLKSPRNLQHRWPILSSRSVSCRFCSILPMAEAIRR